MGAAERSVFFMNRSGLSYRIRSGYRFADWRLPFAVEYKFEGEKRTEVSLGAEKHFYKLTTTIGKLLAKG